MALTIQERLKDLRVECGLTLEQLAEQTHLSKSALGSYEAEDFKDISHYTLSSGETQTESVAQTGTVSAGMGNVGGFGPLAAVSGEKKVVLGLVTTKRPELEDKAAVIARIHDAAKYIPLDRLCLSPQCGFASCEIGNKLTEAQQWAKLALVKEIAEEVWG